MTLQLVVLISGQGSNLIAITQAIAAKRCDANIALVVSDRADAAGLTFAREQGYATTAVRMSDYDDRKTWDAALTEAVAAASPQLVVLAGFMRLLGSTFLSRFPRRIINVHPALLPLFPGTDGAVQALASGMRITGCSVHLVDHGVDTGPIIAQAAVPVRPDDDAVRLQARIQQAEHVLLPRVIAAIASGQVTLSPHVSVDALPITDQTLFSFTPSDPES